MPRGDGTGPMGRGPMTGRGAGFCAGFAAPGYANLFVYGRGFGRGKGFRRMYYATGLPRWARFGGPYTEGEYFPAEVDEKEFLKKQAEFLEKQLGNVKKRLEELEE
ncbi:MAG: DUF5320 domain-containing protein [Clostridia bacterium]|jgi:hypothetical protein